MPNTWDSFPNRSLALPCPALAALLAWHFWHRHANGEVIARRVVLVAAALVILTIDTDAVEQITSLRGAIDQRVAGETVFGDLRQVLGCQRLEPHRVVAVLSLVAGKGQRDVKVRLPLLGPVGGLLDLVKRWSRQADQDVADRLAPNLGGLFFVAHQRCHSAEFFLPGLQLVSNLIQLLGPRAAVLETHHPHHAIVETVNVAEGRVPIDVIQEVLPHGIADCRWRATGECLETVCAVAVDYHDALQKPKTLTAVHFVR